MSSSRNGGAVIGGFLLGAAVGAGLAILLAPGFGAVIRRRIGETARELGEEAQDKLESIRDAIAGGAQVVKAAVKEGRDVYARETSASNAPPDSP